MILLTASMTRKNLYDREDLNYLKVSFMKSEKVIVIGSGPAGLTAALYTARARLEPLVISGTQLGGQISITNEVENYPGFPEGTTGPELVELMRKQAEVFGARLAIDEVTKVDFTGGSPFTIETHSETYEAEAVIVTAGASPKRLGIPGEEELIGRGVSFCATCDGFFFPRKRRGGCRRRRQRNGREHLSDPIRQSGRRRTPPGRAPSGGRH